MKKYQGGCACGAIKYTFENEPINSVFCYCKACQVHTGSDKWFGLWVPIVNFTFVKGVPSSFSRQGDSSKELIYHFCSECGTTLCLEAVVGRFYSVASTTLNDNDNLSPKMAIYTASAPVWAVFPEGLPKFDRLPSDIVAKYLALI